MFRPVFIILSAGVMVILTSSFISANFCSMMSYTVCYFAIKFLQFNRFKLLGLCYFAIEAILLLQLHQCSHSLKGLLFWYLCYFAFKFYSNINVVIFLGGPVCYFCSWTYQGRLVDCCISIASIIGTMGVLFCYFPN